MKMTKSLQKKTRKSRSLYGRHAEKEKFPVKWVWVYAALVPCLAIISAGFMKENVLNVSVLKSFVSNLVLWPDTDAYQMTDHCRPEVLRDFWNEIAVPGYHILCFSTTSKGTNGANFDMTIYKQGMRDSLIESTGLPITTSWSGLRQRLLDLIGLKEMSTHGKQGWAIYSTVGSRLLSESSNERTPGENAEVLVGNGVVLLFEGGQFLWPAIRIGFKRNVDLYSVMPEGSPSMEGRNRTAILETLSITPVVFSVTGFLSLEECRHIQDVAEPHIASSTVVLAEQDQHKAGTDFRTSQTAFIYAENDAVLTDIDYRTASLVRIPRNHQEQVQVIRYGEGQKYTSHHDYFDPAYFKDASTQTLLRQGRRNRLATVLWYLSDVESGGETIFPRFNGSIEKDHTDCDTGLLIKPEAGKVIIFYSLQADGELDLQSFHGSCPVTNGVKWAANKWVWSERMGYVRY